MELLPFRTATPDPPTNTQEKTSSPWTELGNDLIDVSPTWGTGL